MRYITGPLTLLTSLTLAARQVSAGDFPGIDHLMVLVSGVPFTRLSWKGQPLGFSSFFARQSSSQDSMASRAACSPCSVILTIPGTTLPSPPDTTTSVVVHSYHSDPVPSS